jgi:hypothetical protein
MDKTRGTSMDYSFKDLMNLAHKDGITIIKHNDAMVPCVLVKPERFDEIMKACYGKRLGVDANLNILHDDQRHVFVEMLLKFSTASLEHKVLLYANENLQFFEHLAESGIIALAPKSVSQTSTNIFMVQLPRRDAAEKALELIKSYLQ